MSHIRADAVLPGLDRQGILRLIDELQGVTDQFRRLERSRAWNVPAKSVAVDRLLSSLAPLGYELLALAGMEPSLPVLDPQDIVIKESARC